MRIDSCTAREILDSRGRPTIEVELKSGALSATAGVPSGKSTGSHEAKELRDEGGKGILRAVAAVNGEIAALLSSCDWESLQDIDAALIALDGTSDKHRLGSNSILGTSMAALRLFALEQGVPLWKYISIQTGYEPKAPHLFTNVINGGVHADMRLPFQEYMVVAAAPTVKESFAELKKLFDILKTELERETGSPVPMGDEGGYSPTFDTLEKPFAILSKLSAGKPHLSLAIDAAASELFTEVEYHLIGEGYSREELLGVYTGLAKRFPLKSIEDPFAEGDEEGFRAITAALGESHLIVGDDLTVTDPARIARAATERLANAVIVKPNQIGTVTETFAAVKAARAAGWKVIVSHRSGETLDSFISDLAYGIGADGIKAGGLAQQERVEKYLRLIEIEAEAA